jgi:hypothetical protein
MPKMSVDVAHNLSRDEAQSRMKGMLDDLKDQYGDKVTDVSEQWKGDSGTFSFKAMGMNVAGTMNVTDSDVQMRGDIPWAAKPFQGTIEATIRERTERLLKA